MCPCHRCYLSIHLNPSLHPTIDLHVLVLLNRCCSSLGGAETRISVSLSVVLNNSDASAQWGSIECLFYFIQDVCFFGQYVPLKKVQTFLSLSVWINIYGSWCLWFSLIQSPALISCLHPLAPAAILCPWCWYKNPRVALRSAEELQFQQSAKVFISV